MKGTVTKAQLLRAARTAWPELRPWLAVAALVLIYALPDAVHDAGLKLQRLRFSGDLLAIMTLAAVSLHMSRWARWARWTLLAYAVLLFAFRLDRMVLGFLMQEEPLLYDQVFMARHLFVLVSDLWNNTTALLVTGFICLLGLTGWTARRLLRLALPLARDPNTLRVGYVLWLIALPASASDVLGLSRRPLVEWISPRFVANVDESLRTYRAVKHGLNESPYQGLDRIRLTRRPDVDIYVVESYGRMLWDNSSMRKRHLALLKGLEERLSTAGWHMASAFSTSPVRGARSWLADATMILGMPIQYEAVFHHALSRVAQRPSLVGFFNAQGYETVAVNPSDRRRPGIALVNYYGYSRQVHFEKLGYTGPRIGWGVVPDQYTISWVEEHIVRPAQKPRFMNFHLVSSHAPWTQVPERVQNWRDLNHQEGARLADATHSVGQTLRRLGHYDRQNRDTNFRPLKAKYVNGYVATLAYDLDLLADLMVESQSKDRLVVLIGDHQPPLVASNDSTYDAPVHVLSRDPELLNELRSRGFSPGLRLSPTVSAAMGHGGMFSLLTRVLTRCCAEGSALPPFLPTGRNLLNIRDSDKQQ